MSTHPNDPSRIRVRLYGGPVVMVGDQPVRLSRFQAYLVALIFGHGRDGISRSRVVEMLWDEPGGPPQRHRLSQLMYGLRQKVGGRAIVKDDGFLVSDLPSQSVDLECVSEFFAHNEYEEIKTVVSGGLLARLEGVPTNDFGRWAESFVRRSEEAMTDNLSSACHEARGRSDWQRVGRIISVATDLCPPREDFLQYSIRHLVMTGQGARQVAREVAAFEARWTRTHVKPWSPNRTTTELLEDTNNLLQNRRPSTGDDRRLPLIGRESDLKLLHGLLAGPATKGLKLLTILGEAGIGKTRLGEEMLDRLALEGQQVFTARAAEFEDCIPLNPIIEAIGRVGDDEFQRLGEPWASVLQSLVPKPHASSARRSAPIIQPGSVSRRLFEAFLLLFDSLSRKQPLILFLDDAHWMDETSLAVIQFVRRRAKGNLAIVLVFTTELIRRRPCIETFLESLRSDCQEIVITGLEAEHAGALVRRLADDSIRERELEVICSLGAGNPFYLKELTAEFRAGRLTLTADPGEPLIPPSLTNLLEPRISRLSQSAKGMLAALAVSGHKQSLPELVTLLGASLTSVIETTEELLDLRLVREDSCAYRIAHPLLRRTVYDRLGNARRRTLHGLVARLLTQKDDDAYAGSLAMHYDRSGNAPDAVKYSLRAADHAERSGAIPEAIQHLTIAQRNESHPDKSQEILLRLGHLHYLHQNLEAASGILGLACDQLRAAGDDRRAWEAELEQLDCLLRLNPPRAPHLLSRLREMKSSLLADALYEAYARALDIEIHALDRQSDAAGIQACFHEADLVAGIGSPRAQCMAHCTLAMQQLYGIPRRALVSARKAVELAEAHNLDAEWPTAINRLILVLNYQGLLSSGGGFELIDQAEKAAERVGDLLLRFTLRLNRGVWHLDTGEYELAEAAFDNAHTLLDDAGTSAASCLLNVNFGELNLMTGQIPRAAGFFQEAVTATKGSTPANLATAAEAGLGICELHQGHLRKARTRSASLRFPQHWSFDPSLPVIFQAQMHSRRGDLAAAIKAFATTASSIKDRFPLAWIKLRTEEARLLHKTSRQNATILAQKVHRKSAELGLERRCAALEKLM